MKKNTLATINLPLGSVMTQLIMIKKTKRSFRVVISPELMERLLGGEWPEWQGFNFDAVHHFTLEGNQLVPYDIYDDAIPAPNFMLALVDDRYLSPKVIPLRPLLRQRPRKN